MNFAPSKHLQQLKKGIFHELAEAKRRVEQSGTPVIDLSVGSPDLPPPDFAREILSSLACDGRHYGYTLGAIPGFNDAVARFYKKRYGVPLDPETEILQLIGSQDGLAHLGTAILNPKDVVLVPDPGYPIYEAGVRMAGGHPLGMPLTEENGFLPDLTAVPEDIARQARMLILNYPSNPVAATADRSFYEEVIRFARKYEILVVQDFTYSELVFDGKTATSILSVPGAKDVAIEFNSFSKTFNLAGCRIGYVTGNAQVLNILSDMMSHTHYGVFYPIQQAAIACLEQGESFIQQQVKRYESRRDTLVEALSQGGWNLQKPPATMYVWANIPKGWASIDFAFRLLEKTGVVVTPGSAFGLQGEGYVRMTLTQAEGDLQKAAERMSHFVKQGVR
ncbi:aminotransferase [Marinithermofilum abyssi]|uniref:Aminotransferase n=1 Tax=Marinithermofilum abyssi TaxID=1571185 RepID=A0A8J2YAH0_9BACL|nr:aminotransferase class I/II-fold pyridoxal phosphate-dependent enzyme [Marinithermofilum abyssi]GGE13826.1 aminotransferase [Marinithermofilum abyssi]